MNCKFPWMSGLVLAAVCCIGIGCASEPVIVPSSGVRSPTSVEQITILEKQPRRYEILGNVSVPVGGDVRWDERGQAKAGFDQLKQQAAAKGANALLLQLPEGESDFAVLASDGQRFYTVPMKSDPRTAFAQAIFVLEW